MKSALPVAAAISVFALASDASAASIQDVFGQLGTLMQWAFWIAVAFVIVALVWRFATELQARGSEAFFGAGIMLLLGLLFLVGFIAYVSDLTASLTAISLVPGL